ncbi:MAG: cytochrome c biogenesis protein CcsA [Polyangiaceae bacterium]
MAPARSVAEDAPAAGAPAAGAAVAATRAGQSDTRNAVFLVLLALTAACCIGTVQMIAFHAPVESTMGVVQKIFYFHVPSAYAMYLGATVCFVGSAAYLYKGTAYWDAFAKAGAEVAVAMGVMVCISGPLWAAKAWGVYWTWDPRLTTSMLSLLVYVAYVVLRAFSGNGESERKFAAALGILGAANLPIIHYSVKKWGGNHPTVITGNGGGITPDMRTVLMMGFLTFTLLTVVFVWQRLRVELASRRLEDAEHEALAMGITEE